MAIGIGGAVDILAGTKTRAPLWMRKAGFEWLWRLLGQPNRFIRILKAIIIFPTLALLEKNEKK